MSNLSEEYRAVIGWLNVDIEHLELQLLREDDPRECAHLRRIMLEMIDKRAAYQLALNSME